MSELAITGIVRLTCDGEAKSYSGGTWYSFGVCAYRKNVKEGKQAVDFFDAGIFYKEVPVDTDKVLRKGNLIYLNNAQLRNDQYKADGQDRSKIKINISSFEVLNMNPQETPEPPKYISSAKQAEVKQVKHGVSHPTDLPPPIEKKPSVQTPKFDNAAKAMDEPEFPEEPPWS